MKKLYILLLLAFASFAGFSQTAASYGFSEFSAPFASIAATGTPIPTLSDDDYTEGSIPIGFSFNFCGTSYTSLSACSNGWISLNNSTSVEFDNFPAWIDGPGWLMPYWDDLDGFFGTAYYQTTGTAPNRVFTIEWNNWESLVAISGAATFQVKLYETSNIIDFHYGPGSFFLSEATIGIANDNISDWQTLSDETPAAVPLPSPTFEDLVSFSPDLDQVFRWTPSCTLPDMSGVLTVCAGSTTTLHDDTLGGTWTSGTPAVATVDASTGVVTGVAAGTSGITYTSASGCTTSSVVTVLATTPVVGTYTVCAGLTTTLTNATSGGTWSSGSGAVADVDPSTGVVSAYSPGTATISYTLPSLCIVTAVVTVYAVPSGVTGPATVCVGSTAAFTSASPGGTWSSSFSSIASVDPSTGVVTGVTGGISTITYTLPGGCYRTVDVTVNPIPAPITGGGSICIAGTLTLSNTTFGGTWTSSNVTVATIDPGTGVLTGMSAGTTNITYTLASGCYRATVVTVTAVVSAITGDFEICRTETTTLSNTTTGGTWSSSTPAVGTITSTGGAFTGISAGTSTVTYTLGSGCFTTAVMTVDPLQAITGTASLCVGATTTLSNSVAGGTWSTSSAAIAMVSTSGVVTGVSAGTANITYTNTYGCDAIQTVTVNALPTAISGDAYICIGNTSTLTGSPVGGTWSATSGGAFSIGTSTGLLTGLAVGTGTVTYTLSSGCYITAIATIDAVPAAITGVSVLCPATTAIYSHSVPGGTWSSSDVSVATVSSSGVVTGIGLAGGTATITYTLPSSGCIATKVVTVYPAPAAITGSTTVCVGYTTTLSTTSLGATWASGNTAVATIGAFTGTVTGIAAGTATITCFGTNGCMRTTVVTVNTNPATPTGTAVVCVGATTTLASTPTGGTWSSSNTAVGTVSTSGGVVGGISANTVAITYTAISGCFATRVVTVNPIPTNFTPTTTSSVCLGQTITLATTPSGGTWSSSNATNAPVSTGGVVTGNAVGTATISYTLATGCARTRTITVNPLPAAISGLTIVCPASSITLSSTSTPGTWSSSNTAVATVVTGTGVVTGVAGGTTNITYTLATGCYTTLVVTVIAAPIASITPLGDTVLCPGDFVTLVSSAAPGTTYEWYNGTTLIPGATSSTYIATTTGNYKVKVSVSAGCSTTSVPMSVTVVPATATITVPGGTTATCEGTAVTLNANTGTGLSYQWELGGVAIAGATTSTYNALLPGIYTVRVTNSAGCWAVSSPVTVTVAAAPSATVTASGPLTFCSGGSVTLSVASGAGYTYQWYDGVTPISGATAASYMAITSASYHAEITNSTGCLTTTASVVVVVNPLPDVTISHAAPLIFCAGGNVVLTATTGYTYQWYRNSTAIAGATNASYLATVSGNYRVRLTNTATGCTDMTHADTVVTVLSAPTTIPLTPQTFCWGGSALLSTSVSYLGGAVEYQWYFNTTAIPGATNSTYNATVAGSYYCRITSPAAGCFVVTTSCPVTEMPLPNPVITFDGTTFHAQSYFLTYQWYKDLVAISGATSAATPAIGNGSYKVAVTDTNGCQSVSLAYPLTGWTGVADVNKPDVRIYPNPAKDIVHVEASVPCTVVITSVDGRVVVPATTAKDISLSGLANGLYMLSVYDAQQTLLKTTRLVRSAD